MTSRLLKHKLQQDGRKYRPGFTDRAGADTADRNPCSVGSVQHRRPAESGSGRERQHVRTSSRAAELLPEPDGNPTFLIGSEPKGQKAELGHSGITSSVRD